VKGRAVFVRNTKKSTRLLKVWTEVTQHVGAAGAVPVVENMGQWLRKGDLVFPPISGWESFIARGAGTCVRCGSTVGFYHQLEDTAERGFKSIESIDMVRLPYPGRPDVLLRNGAGKLVQREYKVVFPGRGFTGRSVSQLNGNVEMILTQARQVSIDSAQQKAFVKDALGRLEYVFRGPERADVRDQVIEALGDALGPKFEELAESVVISFRNKGVPF